jgi:dTDP-4-dehydrorhamnose reductase
VKILLTGRNGQVGFELKRALALLGEVTAVDREACDLADEPAVRAIVRTVCPDVIVNAAAYTAVDRAETDATTAMQVNGHAPGVLGEEAKKLGALVVHFSTDYVFDGRKVGTYVETDLPNPLCEYGRSKLQGERTLASATDRHLIFRTSWVVGAHGANFLKTMLRLAGERDKLSVVADQWGAPTPAALLADATAHVLMRYASRSHDEIAFPYGTYHVTAGGETNWHDYARFVIHEARLKGRDLRVQPENIEAITSRDYLTAAKRPLNSRLCTRKFSDTFKLRLPPWEDGVRHILGQLL